MLIHGAGRDSAYVAKRIQERTRSHDRPIARAA
jgi:hypothetical protein